MTEPFRLACVQLNAGNDFEKNIATASALVREAAAKQARLIALPECAILMEASGRIMREKAQTEEAHTGLAALSNLAAELEVWLLVGSLTVDIGEDRIANRSFLIDDTGRVRARYDKIHMFDVSLPDGESFHESRTYRPGDEAVLVDTPFGALGMTICYDLRFPGLYRSLAEEGASLLSVPSAFTRQTGEAHWHILLRARAIETGCFVFAPAQWGTHGGNRQSYGHSLIIDPWGEVLADGGREGDCVIVADIDPAKVETARRAIPSLANGRNYRLAHIR